MGDIFTAILSDFAYQKLSIEEKLTPFLWDVRCYLRALIPNFVKYTIGYCHFYYQLGYGIIVYVYIYRRHRAKKTKNWQTFYGNSSLNWAYTNVSLFIKHITQFSGSRDSIRIIQQTLKVLINTPLKFTFGARAITHISVILTKFARRRLLYPWTPIFKRSSYIALTSMIKRFIKK